MKKTIDTETPSTVCYANLETFARARIQHWLQDLLETEVSEFLGRGRHERAGQPRGYRDDHSKPRRLALTSGTVTVRRPQAAQPQRVLREPGATAVQAPEPGTRSDIARDLLARPVLRGLRTRAAGPSGRGRPTVGRLALRLKSAWVEEYADWKQPDLPNLDVVYTFADSLYLRPGSTTVPRCRS